MRPTTRILIASIVVVILIMVGLVVARGAANLVENHQTRHSSIQQAIEELSQ